MWTSICTFGLGITNVWDILDLSLSSLLYSDVLFFTGDPGNCNCGSCQDSIIKDNQIYLNLSDYSYQRK